MSQQRVEGQRLGADPLPQDIISASSQREEAYNKTIVRPNTIVKGPVTCSKYISKHEN